jgi:hypothetical protein
MADASGIRAGKAYVEVGADDSKLRQVMNAAAGRLKAWGASLAHIGGKIGGFEGLSKFEGLAAAGEFLTGPSGIAAGLALASRQFAEMGSRLNDVSQRTGFSVESLGELGHAAEQSGSSFEGLETGAKKMQRFVVEARGSKESKQLLHDLGITLNELQGLSPDKQFELLGERLSEVGDAAQRTDAAMTVFGKSGTELLPIFAEGAEGVRKLREEAIALGRPTAEQARKADELGDAFGSMWRAVKNGVFAIGSELAPTIKAATKWITDAAVAVRRWIEEHPGLIKVIFLSASALSGLGIALALVGKGFSIMGSLVGTVGSILSTAIGAVVGMIGFLLSPIGLVVAALGGLAAWFLTSTEEGQGALGRLGQAFGTIAGVAREAFGGIATALAAGDIEGAAGILWAALNAGWAQVVETAKGEWGRFTAWIRSHFGEQIDAIAGFFNKAMAIVADFFGKAIDWFRSLSPETQGAIEKIALFGGAFLLLNKVIPILGLVKTALLAVVSNPVLLGFAALATAIALVAKHLHDADLRAQEALDSIGKLTKQEFEAHPEAKRVLDIEDPKEREKAAAQFAKEARDKVRAAQKNVEQQTPTGHGLIEAFIPALFVGHVAANLAKDQAGAVEEFAKAQKELDIALRTLARVRDLENKVLPPLPNAPEPEKPPAEKPPEKPPEETALEKALRELREAIDRAAKAPRKENDKRFEKFWNDFMGRSLTDKADQVRSFGTFSKDMLAQTFGGGREDKHAEKTAKHAEAIAKHSARMVELAQRGRIVFGRA